MPGLANPADIPSRVPIPFIPDGDTFKLDPDRLEPEDKPCVDFLCVTVCTTQLATFADLSSFFSTLCVLLGTCIRVGRTR